MDVVFGMHNMPGLPSGKLYFTAGPIMAAVDDWEVVLTGVGSHGSMPERSVDPVVAGAGGFVMSFADDRVAQCRACRMPQWSVWGPFWRATQGM